MAVSIEGTSIWAFVGHPVRGAIARWADAHGHVLSVQRGRWRELYLETNDSDYSDWLIEVQLELAAT